MPDQNASLGGPHWLTEPQKQRNRKQLDIIIKKVWAEKFVAVER